MNRRGFLMVTAAALALPATRASALPEAQRVASELANAVADLPGIVMLGAKSPDVTLYEFFDYNCPYCKQSSKDVPALLKSDKNLAYGLVNFAVLGIGSIGATKVALAFRNGRSPKQYLAFHEKLFGLHGPVDGQRALGVAVSLGANKEDLTQLADSDAIGAAALSHVKLGDSLGFQATPSYLGQTEGFSGYIDLAEKRKLIGNFRTCEKSRC